MNAIAYNEAGYGIRWTRDDLPKPWLDQAHERLAAHVRDYQRDKGLLPVDGKLGDKTVRELRRDRTREMLDAAKCAALVARAESACGRGIKYDLGAGGMDPLSSTPACFRNECDCSGFVAWWMGVSRRHLFPGLGKKVWLDTDFYVREARAGRVLARPRLVLQVPAAVEGCLLVYGDSKDAAGRTRQGHVAIVVAAEPGRDVVIVDCSSSGGGVSRRSGGTMERKAGVICCAPLACFRGGVA